MENPCLQGEAEEPTKETEEARNIRKKMESGGEEKAPEGTGQPHWQTPLSPFYKGGSWGWERQNEFSQVSGQDQNLNAGLVAEHLLLAVNHQAVTHLWGSSKRPKGLKTEEVKLACFYFKVKGREVFKGQIEFITLIWETFSIWAKKVKWSLPFMCMWWKWRESKSRTLQFFHTPWGRNTMVPCIPGIAVKKQCFPINLSLDIKE